MSLYKYVQTARKHIHERREDNRLQGPLRLAARNAEFLGRYAGQRCFILCNGPSVKRQDIRALKNEHVFSVSSGYHHPDYALINPRFHCIPQLTYGMITREDAVNWFREIHRCLGPATLFLNYTEEALVREENLLPGRDVRYLVFSGGFEQYKPLAKPDIARRIPAVQSVPIMCLMVAMYMGFDRIYLLGTDHDHFLSGEYKYFYEPTVLKGKDSSADANGRRRGGWYEELAGLASLWKQYREVRHIAEAQHIEIFNATAGGELDEFPRVELQTLLPPGAGSGHAPAACSGT
ncbi:MAG: hypothetical protein JWN73_5076 [Betaproteobacteria bacterium]|nr:hypothetical protein [Betaproteobacteria bacterium]